MRRDEKKIPYSVFPVLTTIKKQIEGQEHPALNRSIR
jgi:hypothetical protein